MNESNNYKFDSTDLSSNRSKRNARDFHSFSDSDAIRNELDCAAKEDTNDYKQAANSSSTLDTNRITSARILIQNKLNNIAKNQSMTNDSNA